MTDDPTPWLTLVLKQIQTSDYPNMSVTISTDGEYTSSTDLLRPCPAPPPAVASPADKQETDK